MWKEIVDYSILSEFDLLRQSCSDIRQNDWAKPAYCEATVKYFKLSCAHEEVAHIEVEVCHLQTAIHDEEQLMKATIDRLSQMDHALATELERQHCCRSAVNSNIILHLNQIKTLIGYNGREGIGTRLVMSSEPFDAEMTNYLSGDRVSHSNSDRLFFVGSCLANILADSQNDPPMHVPISNGAANTFVQPNYQFTYVPFTLAADIKDVECEDDRVATEMMAEYLYDLGDN